MLSPRYLRPPLRYTRIHYAELGSRPSALQPSQASVVGYVWRVGGRIVTTRPRLDVERLRGQTDPRAGNLIWGFNSRECDHWHSRHRERQEKLEIAAEEARALLSERRAVLDNVDTIAAFAEDMSDFLMTSEITESRAFIKSFVKEIKVKPGKATVYYTLPTPPDSPIGGGDAAEVALHGPVRSSVHVGGLSHGIAGVSEWRDGELVRLGPDPVATIELDQPLHALHARPPSLNEGPPTQRQLDRVPGSRRSSSKRNARRSRRRRH